MILLENVRIYNKLKVLPHRSNPELEGELGYGYPGFCLQFGNAIWEIVSGEQIAETAWKEAMSQPSHYIEKKQSELPKHRSSYLTGSNAVGMSTKCIRTYTCHFMKKH